MCRTIVTEDFSHISLAADYHLNAQPDLNLTMNLWLASIQLIVNFLHAMDHYLILDYWNRANSTIHYLLNYKYLGYVNVNDWLYCHRTATPNQIGTFSFLLMIWKNIQFRMYDDRLSYHKRYLGLRQQPHSANCHKHFEMCSMSFRTMCSTLIYVGWRDLICNKFGKNNKNYSIDCLFIHVLVFSPKQ